MIYILARAHVNKKINSLDMHTSWSATFRQIRVLIESRNLPKMEPTYISLHGKSTCLSVEYNILIKKKMLLRYWLLKWLCVGGYRFSLCLNGVF